MDMLETLVLKRGWPVPLTPYYLVDYEKMLFLLDKLRVSLQDEMDSRFINAFNYQEQAKGKKLYHKQNKYKGKERSH